MKVELLSKSFNDDTTGKGLDLSKTFTDGDSTSEYVKIRLAPREMISGRYVSGNYRWNIKSVDGLQ
jgi:hypothetical protein